MYIKSPKKLRKTIVFITKKKQKSFAKHMKVTSLLYEAKKFIYGF